MEEFTHHNVKLYLHEICLVVRCNSIHLHIPIDLLSLLVNQSTRINSSCVKYYSCLYTNQGNST